MVKQSSETKKNKSYDKDLSPAWEQCPRCRGKDIENLGGFFSNLFSGMGLAGILFFIGIFLWPLLLVGLLVLALSPIIGLSRIGGPDFKCKTCGAKWSKADKAGRSSSSSSLKSKIKTGGLIFLVMFMPYIAVFPIWYYDFERKVKIGVTIWAVLAVIILSIG